MPRSTRTAKRAVISAETHLVNQLFYIKGTQRVSPIKVVIILLAFWFYHRETTKSDALLKQHANGLNAGLQHPNMNPGMGGLGPGLGGPPGIGLGRNGPGLAGPGNMIGAGGRARMGQNFGQNDYYNGQDYPNQGGRGGPRRRRKKTTTPPMEENIQLNEEENKPTTTPAPEIQEPETEKAEEVPATTLSPTTTLPPTTTVPPTTTTTSTTANWRVVNVDDTGERKLEWH